MDVEEIVILWRDSKQTKEQLEIISELTCKHVDVIRYILESKGYAVPGDYIRMIPEKKHTEKVKKLRLEIYSLTDKLRKRETKILKLKDKCDALLDEVKKCKDEIRSMNKFVLGGME